MFRTRGAAAVGVLVLVTIVVGGASAEEADDGPEDGLRAGHVLDRVLDPSVEKASGIAASPDRPGQLLALGETGDGVAVLTLDPDGRAVGELRLRGADPEGEVELSTGPDDTLWVGDLGDTGPRQTFSVWSVDEAASERHDGSAETTEYTLAFPDGTRDADALMVHPRTGDLFVVGGEGEEAAIYQAPSILSTDAPNTLTRMVSAPEDVTSAAFSPDGERFVLAGGDRAYLYRTIADDPKELLLLPLPGERSVAVECPQASPGSEEQETEQPDCTDATLLSTASGDSAVFRTELPAGPPPAPPLLGVYNGPAGERPDETTAAEFGSYPDVANTYYQPDQSINLAYETARILRGTSPNLTITTKGTQLLAGIAHREPAALAWLDRYVEGLERLAEVDPTVPVYATLDHEFRAKTNRGLVTGESADPEVYGRALSVFYERLGQAHPGIRTTYWIVGYDREFEGAVGEAFTVNPEVVVFDPYANTTRDTVETITEADLEWIEAQQWYDGQEIGLGEFGMPVHLGDEALSRFFTDVRGQLEAQGIDWAVFFNRTRDNNHKITTGTFPRAVAAFAASGQDDD